MVTLIILNIILIIILVFLMIYVFNYKKDNRKKVYVNIEKSDVVKKNKHKKNTKIKSEKVFDGVFITDEEYQEIVKNRKGDISKLLDELYKEYEQFKDLNK